MSEHTPNRCQNRRRYEACDDDGSSTFCGMGFKVIRTMVPNFCVENPARGDRHGRAG